MQAIHWTRFPLPSVATFNKPPFSALTLPLALSIGLLGMGGRT